MNERKIDWWNDRTTPSENIAGWMRYVRQQDGSDADISELQDAHERAVRREIIQNSDNLD